MSSFPPIRKDMQGLLEEMLTRLDLVERRLSRPTETVDWSAITGKPTEFPPILATETVVGGAEAATNAEVQNGTAGVRMVTPAGLASRTGTETRTGIVELATQPEVDTGTDATRVVRPNTLRNAAFLPYAMAAGTGTSSGAIASGSGETVAVSFPSGRFGQPPLVMVTPALSARLTVAVLSGITTVGCSVRLDNWSGGNASGAQPFYWVAVQMTAAAAAG